MYRLLWTGTTGYISDGQTTVRLIEKPVVPDLSFDTLYYEEGQNAFFHHPNATREQLTPAQIADIRFLIEAFDFSVATKHYTDENGVYLGVGVYGGQTVPSAPPKDGAHYYDRATMKWTFIHAVDQYGKYIGNMPYYDAPQIVPSAPPSPFHHWINGAWEDPRTLDDIQEKLIWDVELAAEQARARHLTLTKGKAEIYQMKRDQAEAYLADQTLTAADVPFVEKYRLALAVTNPDATLLDSANAIKARANDVLPKLVDIEGILDETKERLRNAVSADDGRAIQEQAIQALGAI